MRIGINASFLRKPGTGIGQVTLFFLKTLAEAPESKKHSFILYLDEAVGTCDWPENFEQKVFLPFWKRDDVPRKLLWEKKLSRAARNDGCDAFLSLYQAATLFEKGFLHVMVVHDLIPILFPEYTGTLSRAWYQKGVNRGILGASQIMSVSESTKKDLITFGVSKAIITTASPAANPIFGQSLAEGEVRETLKKYGLAPGYIYHGGGLEVRKNTEAVLRAYAALAAKGGTSEQAVPQLVVSGKIFSESNPLATPVRTLIRELGLEGKVHLTDFVPTEDLPALYQGAKMFVYPSLYEGFGLPVLEALASGVPVITSRNSSLPEVGGEAVLYVDPANISLLAQSMEKLLKDDDLRSALISKSRGQALQFNWQKFAAAVCRPLNIFL